MLIQSLINSEDKFIWLRVPRTATKAYSQLFFPDGNYRHVHNSYLHEVIHNELGELPAFSVVRNPYTRFKSAIKYAYKRKIESGSTGRFNYSIPTESTDSLATFLTNVADSLVDTNNNAAFETAFLTTDLSFIRLMFRQQADFVGFENVTNFRYENLGELNLWIQTNLGFDTTTVPTINSSGDVLSHIDFSDERIKLVVQKLFVKDFEMFDYAV